MFSLASGIYQNYFGTPQLNVLLIGMEDVGKTTLLERLKVTQFSKKGTQTGVSTKMKRSLSCPAPPKYANAKVLQDDSDEIEEQGEDSFGSQSERPSSSSRRWLNDKQQSSLEDIEWSSREAAAAEVSEQPATEIPEQRNTSISEEEGGEVPDYNLKTGLKMLPLAKIRPTSGQNLAKIDICGAKCHIFDLCGKFRDLWERYYNDAEAVIFCWKLDDKENRDQASILEKVRKEIPDDVPILIFGHVVHPDTNDKVFELGALPTEAFLPNYHSNVMQVYCGSAKTGKGVREAMEWLIPLAKRQAALRNAAARAAALEQATKPL